jgi:hypothetical protein
MYYGGNVRRLSLHRGARSSVQGKLFSFNNEKKTLTLHQSGMLLE